MPAMIQVRVWVVGRVGRGDEFIAKCEWYVLFLFVFPAMQKNACMVGRFFFLSKFG